MVGKWIGGVVESIEGDEPPTVESWTDVSIPGRPDEFAGTDRPVAFRTAFENPRTHDEQRTLLQVRGGFGRTRVWANETYLGEHDTYFTPATFEFEPADRTDVTVVCEQEPETAGIYSTSEVPAELTVPGIWWGCHLQLRPTNFIHDFTARPRVTDDSASIDVRLEIDAGAALDDTVTLSIRPEGFRGGGSMERVSVDGEAGERVVVSTTVDVRDPSLWWPRGYGPQHRYTVRAKLGDDAIERSIGLRTVDRDEKGLLINGERVFARGLTRLPGGDPVEDVHRATAANANLVRVRAHVLPHEFYEACDEAGILVWQDLPVSGPRAELSSERGSKLATALTTEYGNHPSVALYGVWDEPVETQSGPFGSGLRAKLGFRWRAWRTAFDDRVAKAVAASFPDDVPVISITGPPGTDPDAMTLYPGWEYLRTEAVEWLLDTYPQSSAIVGGFGAASLTDESKDRSLVPGVDGDLIDRWLDASNRSQRYHAQTVKHVAETLRRRRCGVIVASTIRDTADAGGRGIVTSRGEQKEAFDAVESAFEPIQAVLDGQKRSGSVDVTVINDTANRVEPTVTWRSSETSETETVTADPFTATDAGSVTIPADADQVELEIIVNDRTITNEYLL